VIHHPLPVANKVVSLHLFILESNLSIVVIFRIMSSVVHCSFVALYGQQGCLHYHGLPRHNPRLWPPNRFFIKTNRWLQGYNDIAIVVKDCLWLTEFLLFQDWKVQEVFWAWRFKIVLRHCLTKLRIMVS